MSEPVFTRISPLADIAVQGRFGAGTGAAGVTLSVRHPLTIFAVIARKGKGKAVADALAKLKNTEVRWAGPDQYFVHGEVSLPGLASVSDQSHGRVVIRIGGPKARSVLAKGTPVDLHPDLFPVGKSALTQMAHVGVHLTRVSAEAYDLSVFRGFSESFWEWLTEQSEEFGYLVR